MKRKVQKTKVFREENLKEIAAKIEAWLANIKPEQVIDVIISSKSVNKSWKALVIYLP